MTVLVSPCQRAKSSARSGRTRVWVTMLTVMSLLGGSLAKSRSGVKGRWAKRTPVALASALETAGATGLMRALALGLGAERADRVDRVGEEDVGVRHVGEGRDAVVAQLRVHHRAALRHGPCSRSAPSR